MRYIAKTRKPLMRLASRIGRRGSYLMFLALLDLLFGYSIIVQASPLFTRTSLFLPDNVWGWIWIGAGVILFQQAFVRVDRIGYIIAVALKFVWATIQLYDWLVTPNDPRGWVAAAIWLAFGTLTAIVSNWPEHRIINARDFNGE